MPSRDTESGEQSFIMEYTDEKREAEHPHKKHSGRALEVKIRIPQVLGQEIKSPNELKKVIRDEFPGIQDRDDYDSLMKGSCDHFKILHAFGERKTVKHHELEEVGTKLDINGSTVRNWTIYGVIPSIYKILEKAISKDEAKVRIAGLRGKLEGLGSWKDVENRLDKMYPNKEYEGTEMFRLRKRHTIKFFKFLEELEKGGTVKGITHRTGTPYRIVESLMKGNLPYLIRHVIPSLKSRGKKRSIIYKVKAVDPRIRGVRIESIEHLKKFIETDFLGFSSRKDLPELLRAAEFHFELIHEYRDKDLLVPKDVHNLEAKTGFSYLTIKRWLCDAGTPIIYNLLRKALTYNEANEKLEKLQSQLNGVISMGNLDRRLEHLYLREEIQCLPKYRKHREHANKFFRFLRALGAGGTVSDIARKAQLTDKYVEKRLYSGVLPRLVRIAASVPAEAPKHGKKWLPLEMTRGGRLKQFIQIPLKITSAQDILDILKQIPSLRTPWMTKFEQQFGNVPKHRAFMYLLGAILSDGGFGRKRAVSTRVELGASGKYDWSEDFGRGFCYALGRVGIRSNRRKDNMTQQENGNIFIRRGWISARSSFLVWVRKTLLGLRTPTPKSWSRVHADWIVQMPEDWRVAFLQGIADGDGCATIKGFYTEISTTVNPDFLVRLLASLGVHASPSPTGVRIRRKEDIRRAEQLPMFRYAVGRQNRLTQLTAMLDSMKRQQVSEKELKTIMDLHRQGFTPGIITEMLWSKYRITRRPTVLARIIKRNNEKWADGLNRT